MDSNLAIITKGANKLAEDAQALADKLQSAVIHTSHQTAAGVDPFIYAITIFVLACFVGYYVVWKVTPALHTPLMAVTNAISGIIIVGAIIAVGPEDFDFPQFTGFIAVVLASINIFGGFIVTHRMLDMFRKK
jgi:NAD(P) transhydrogenase subunit alpha